jgi:hypothetical protein
VRNPVLEAGQDATKDDAQKPDDRRAHAAPTF